MNGYLSSTQRYGSSFDYFSVIRLHEIKEWYSLILACITTKFCGCMPSDHVITSRDMLEWQCFGSGWERCGISLARPRTHHSRNLSAVCHTPKTLFGGLSQLFLIYSFSTFLTTLFLISLVKLLYSTFHLLFFAHIHCTKK